MKFHKLINKLWIFIIQFINGKDVESIPKDIRQELELNFDKSFAYFVFYFHFFFYFILLFIPQETVSIVFVNHIGISVLASIIFLFAKFDLIVSKILHILLGMIHILIFFTIGQLQFLMNGSLSVQFLNNYYLTISILIIANSFRFHQMSCIIPGITFMILHLISIMFFSTYSEEFLSLLGFLPQGIYFLSMLIGTVLIQLRRKDLSQINRLNREKTVIAQELKLAKKVQDTLFPTDIEFNGLKFEVFRQSHNYIGGDFYDFVQLREGNLGIFLTDIAGHGISSALVASIMKVLVATIPYGLKTDPVKFLGYLDYHLEKNLDNYHASAIYIFIDFQEKKILLGNAGHPYILYCPVGKEFRELVTSGAILGFKIREPIVDVMEINFNVGDRFFIYTDGLIESPTGIGRSLTENDLIKILNLRRGLQNLSIMKEVIIEDIYSEFKIKHFSDDTMFLLFEIVERK